eukprot:TRINITY_DN2001_c0_g1_i1.p1 TRINITY_DN2001_c0_g1~~TRINITY_DN2001_c0_g1_i1.p1  ORF type:complete len:878 (-),score=197.16 TRINITY_DN2001_c0_g1_i1:300-2666(-)
MGKFALPLSDFISQPDVDIDKRYQLLPSSNHKGEVTGEIQLIVRYHPQGTSNNNNLGSFPVHGSFNLRVNQLNNLTKNGKYYCKIEYHDKNNHSNWETSTRENGIWNQMFHCWVSVVPSIVIIHLIKPNTIGKDDKLGIVRLEFNTMIDVVEKKSIALIPEPSRQTALDAELEIEYSIRFTSNSKYDPFGWPFGTHVLVEPVPYWNVVEVQGPVSDMELLELIQGLNVPIPRRLATKKSSRLNGWAMDVSSSSNLWREDAASRLKWNKTQNVALKLVNSFARLGFTLTKCDQIHLIWVGSGDNRRQIPVYSPTFWLVKTHQKITSYLPNKYLLVEPVVTMWGAVNIDVQGDFDPNSITSILNQFEPRDIIDKDGSHVLWSLKIKGINAYTIFTVSELRRVENILQNFLLKLLDLLATCGFTYHTVYGFGHLLYYTGNTKQGNYLLVDPLQLTPTAHARIELQGAEVTDQLAMKFAEGLSKTVESTKEKGQILSWALPVPGTGGLTFTMGTAQKKEDLVQNFLLNILTKAENMGYWCYGPHGTDCFLLQRISDQPKMYPNNTGYLLIDPAMVGAYSIDVQVELQGNLTREMMQSMVQWMGLEKFKERATKERFYAWVVPLGSFGMITTLNDIRIKSNRIQQVMMMMLTWLNSQSYYYPVTQYGDGIVLRFDPNRVVCDWLLIDCIVLFGGGICIELQGCTVAAEIMSIFKDDPYFPQPVVVEDKGKINCWRINTTAVASVFSLTNRFAWNTFQNEYLRLVNSLSKFGWVQTIPYSNGYTPGTLFSRVRK